MLLVNDYLNLITSQHRTKPKYIEMLSDVFASYSDSSSAFDDIDYKMRIDVAVGEQLDIIGQYVGQSRELSVSIPESPSSILNDEDYRFLLKSKIAANNWKGTIEELYTIWENMFPDIRLVIYDNQNMTCTLLIVGSMSSIQIQMLLLDLLVPKPCGVEYIYTFVSRTLFSYNLDNSQYSGYNVGYWIGTFKMFAFDVDNVSVDVLGGLDLGTWA